MRTSQDSENLIRFIIIPEMHHNKLRHIIMMHLGNGDMENTVARTS